MSSHLSLTHTYLSPGHTPVRTLHCTRSAGPKPAIPGPVPPETRRPVAPGHPRMETRVRRRRSRQRRKGRGRKRTAGEVKWRMKSRRGRRDRGEAGLGACWGRSCGCRRTGSLGPPPRRRHCCPPPQRFRTSLSKQRNKHEAIFMQIRTCTTVLGNKVHMNSWCTRTNSADTDIGENDLNKSCVLATCCIINNMRGVFSFAKVWTHLSIICWIAQQFPRV